MGDWNMTGEEEGSVDERWVVMSRELEEFITTPCALSHTPALHIQGSPHLC